MTYLRLLPLIPMLFGAAPLAAEEVPPVPRFEEVAAEAGVAHQYAGPWEFFVGGGAASFDCNGDRLPDLVLAGGENPASFFINRSTADGALGFEAAALLPGEENPDAVTGTYPINLDNDAHIDLVLLRLGENLLLKGGPECTFTRANEDFGFDGGAVWTTAFAATWESGSAFPTLAFGNYVDRDAEGTPFGTCEDNLLVRPATDAAPMFTDVTALSPSHCTLSLLFTDWAGTGRFDLRVANDRHYYRGGQEQLWRIATGEAPREFGAQDGWRELVIWGMGLAEADLDRDGQPEYAISSMGDTKLQTPENGADDPAYRDIALQKGTTAHRPYQGDNSKPSTGWHTQFADINNDGHLDLFIAKGNVEAMPEAAMIDPDNLLLGTESGGFVESGGAAGIALARRGRGAIVEDFNADGQLDLLVVNREEPASLFRNTGAVGGGFLAVKLNGGGDNPDAIGAVIEVTAGGRSLRKTLQIGGGHASGQIGFAHFGLGDEEAATLRVTWPDGSVSADKEVSANAFLLLDRETGALEVWTP